MKKLIMRLLLFSALAALVTANSGADLAPRANDRGPPLPYVDSSGGNQLEQPTSDVNAGANKPSCGVMSGTVNARTIGYYQARNVRTRPCDQVWPNQLNTKGLTHLNLVFATIDPKTFKIGLDNKGDDEIYRQFLNLKKDGLQSWFGVGGWHSSGNDKTRHTWTELAASPENRKAFVDSAVDFLEHYGFQGLDIDWEWPTSGNHGGCPEEKKNHVALMKDLRKAFGTKYGLSCVLPLDGHYLKGIDIARLAQHVDWINILTYDIHGASKVDGPENAHVRSPTDAKEIDELLSVYWDSGVDTNKMNFGVALYARGFTLSDRNCHDVGCKFSAASHEGACTKQAGMLSNTELKRLIKEKNLHPQMLGNGADAMSVVYEDQWFGYDSPETIEKKKMLASNRCMGGSAVWALDFDSSDEGEQLPWPSPSSSSHSKLCSTGGAGQSSASERSSHSWESNVPTPPYSLVPSSMYSSISSIKASSGSTTEASTKSGSSAPATKSKQSSAGSSAPQSQSQTHSSSAHSQSQGSSSGSSNRQQRRTESSSAPSQSQPFDQRSTGSWLSWKISSSSSPAPSQSKPDDQRSTESWISWKTSSSSSSAPPPSPSNTGDQRSTGSWISWKTSSSSSSAPPPSPSNSGDQRSTGSWISWKTSSSSSAPPPSNSGDQRSTGSWISWKTPSTSSTTSPPNTGDQRSTGSWISWKTSSSSSAPPPSNSGDQRSTGSWISWKTSSGPTSTSSSENQQTTGGSESLTANFPIPTLSWMGQKSESSWSLTPVQPPSMSSWSGFPSVTAPNLGPQPTAPQYGGGNYQELGWRNIPQCVDGKKNGRYLTKECCDGCWHDEIAEDGKTRLLRCTKKQLFGCGCGPFGMSIPPCTWPEIDWPKFDIKIHMPEIAPILPCGIFGCDPSDLFGCDGCGPGPLGFGGFCWGPGCDKPCPKNLCPDGKGWKVGKPPKPKPGDPDPDTNNCDKKDVKTITTADVSCTEFVTASSTSVISMTSSTCITLFSAELTGCNMRGGGTSTQTGTKTKSGSSIAIPTLSWKNGDAIAIPTLSWKPKVAACTRAPLNLDEEEGDNELKRNITIPTLSWMPNNKIAIPTLSWMPSHGSCTRSPCNPDENEGDNEGITIPTLSWQAEKVPVPTLSWKPQPTKSSSSQAPPSSSQKPQGTQHPIPRGGMWTVELKHALDTNKQQGVVQWVMKDSNGFEAGKGWNGDELVSTSAPLPFAPGIFCKKLGDKELGEIEFFLHAQLPGGCEVSWTTGNLKDPWQKKQMCPFQGYGDDAIGCDDISKVKWEQTIHDEPNYWERNFKCWFRYMGRGIRENPWTYDA
ncbi:unnamed protein product [Periconia digitata]|uniref:chitinase n=1 Tax=Periconia digitata TaxID=1303443 RepID=A0A9W4XT51_9PLEO|nr:unnamed protein product [Periconia digitata]